MTEIIWIDGFNLFYKWQRTSDLFKPGCDIARTQDTALRELSNFCGKTIKRITVIMDGGLASEVSRAYGIRVIWCGPGKKADDRILEMLRGKRNKTGNICVISDDRNLTATARSLGAHIIGVNKFLELSPSKSKNKRNDPATAVKNHELSEAEVDAWLDYFNEEE